MVYQFVFIAGKLKVQHFYKNDTKSSLNCFQFWYFWEPQWWRFRLRKFFKSSKYIKYVFKTSLWNHSFASKSFGVSQMILLFLCSRTKSKSVIFKSKNVIFMLLVSQWRSQNLPIYWILLHFFTSSAPNFFFMSQKHTY